MRLKKFVFFKIQSTRKGQNVLLLVKSHLDVQKETFAGYIFIDPNYYNKPS